MLNVSVLMSNAVTAREHADQAKRLPHMRRLSVSGKVQAARLEEAASRMELEAKAVLLRYWRGQSPAAVWEPQAARAMEVPYVDRRHVVRRPTLVPERTLAAAIPLPERRDSNIDWAVLSSLQRRPDGMPNAVG